MARFTDETKWSDKWFRSLKSSEKLVWIYLCDNCDIAGFYEMDFGYIAYHTGLDVNDVQGAIEGLTRGYLGAKGSDFIWIKNFLKHQKNHILNPENNCHKGIIKRIDSKLDLFPSIPELLGAKEPLFRGIGKGKGKGKGKGSHSSSFVIPVVDEVKAYCIERKNSIDAEHFIDHYIARGWLLSNGKQMKDWKACVRTWEKNNIQANSQKPQQREIGDHL